MNIQLWIPQDKSDNSHIAQISKLTNEEIAPIMGGLLEWVQDYNWPVSRDVIPIIIQFQDVALPHISKILQPEPQIFETLYPEQIDGKIVLMSSGSIAIWKYWLISCVIPHFSHDNQEKLFPLIQRIAHYPTISEIAEETMETARDFLSNYRMNEISH